MRLVQIPVADRPECPVALQYAFKIASRHGADVRGFHLRTHRTDTTRMRFGQGTQPGWSGNIQWSKSEKESERMSRSASDLFEEMANKADILLKKKPSPDLSPVALWQDRVGTPDHVLPIVGPTADLMVVSRPARNGGRKTTAFMMQALLNSQRPVLIVPDKPPKEVGAHILVAWNSSRESARLVHAILPTLKAADRVTFLTVGKASGSGPNVNEILHFLAHHGIKAKKLGVKTGSPEVEIRRVMQEVGADLLAMGAYSRNRFAETLFGGVTQYMLFQSDKPVLMLHS